MLFAKYLALCVVLLCFPNLLQAKDLWVSDALTTYVRSGPSDGHRIIGKLRSGDKVRLIATQNGFNQIAFASGKQGWIAQQDLQEEPVAATQVPALRAKLTKAESALVAQQANWQNRLEGLEETLSARKALNAELSEQNQNLLAQLASTQAALRQTQAQLGQEQQQLLMQYLLYGGAVAGAGLLAGLLLPMLGRTTQARRRSEWV